MAHQKEMAGKRFGRLSVVERAGTFWGQALWLCRCDCGEIALVVGGSLRAMNGTKSCGCLTRDLSRMRQTTHGMTKTKLYRTWQRMISRCSTRKNNDHYAWYTSRGIIVCDEWKNSFLVFKTWALANGYSQGLSIDRIDNDGNYEPSNCRWTTAREQANNRRGNRILTVSGERKTIAEWARSLKIDPGMIRDRLELGWPAKCALYAPKTRREPHHDRPTQDPMA